MSINHSIFSASITSKDSVVIRRVAKSADTYEHVGSLVTLSCGWHPCVTVKTSTHAHCAPLESVGNGKAAYSAKSLLKSIKAKKPSEIVGHSVTCEGVTTTLPGGEGVSWSASPGMTHQTTFKAATLLAAINRVLHAMASDETRPHLSALHVNSRDGETVFVATNGHVMSETTVTREGAGDYEMLIPGRAVAALVGMLEAHQGGDVEVSFAGTTRPTLTVVRRDDGTPLQRIWGEYSRVCIEVVSANILFSVAGEHIEVTQCTSAFPKYYKSAMPSRDDVKPCFSVRDIAGAIKALAPHKKLPVTIDGGAIVSDGCTTQSKITSFISVGINARYLSQALSALTESACTAYQGTDATDPVLIEEISTQTKHVIMPVKI